MTTDYLYNRFVPDPVSIANAFFSFDNNTLDLYNRHHATIVGGPVSYIQGYIPHGKAIVLSQSSPTYLQIISPFNLTQQTSFTVEGFFYLTKTLITADLVQFRSNIRLRLINGLLSMSIGSHYPPLNGTSVLSTDDWHHLAFIYDADQQQMSMYIDGEMDAMMRMNISLLNSNGTNGSVVLVGVGYDGYVDQLSISLKSKSASVIRWDASTVAYYPLDWSYLQDSGPNGINGTAANLIGIPGWRRDSVNFNRSDAFFQASGFTALGTPRRSFSITLWVRTETQAGIFLTVSNPSTCLLALAIQTSTNRLVAHFPNSTADGTSVNVLGPQMPLNNWVHVAVTWSVQNRAQLYTSGYLQGSDSRVDYLSNTRGANNSLPMTVTLGKYQGMNANICGTIDDVNTSVSFMGSLDEMYIFTRELSRTEINAILKELPL